MPGSCDTFSIGCIRSIGINDLCTHFKAGLF